MSTSCPQLLWSILSCKGRLTRCASTQKDAFVLKLCKPRVSACTDAKDPEGKIMEDLPGVFVPGDFARLWNIDPDYRATAVLTFNPDKHHPCPCKVRRSLCLTITGAIAECGKPCAQLTLVGYFARNPNECQPPLPKKLRLSDATLTVCGTTPAEGIEASCDCILSAGGARRERAEGGGGCRGCGGGRAAAAADLESSGSLSGSDDDEEEE